MKIKMKNYARHLWLSLLLLVGVTAIAVPGLNETNGTNEADLIISSIDELIAFRNEVNSGNNNYYGKTVELTADLDLGSIDNWVPIGNGAHGEFKATQVSFCGTFNGNGHTISNLKCSNPKFGGLFGSFYGNCNELILKDVNISSNHYAGGIVAHQGSEAGKIINNCKVIGGNITTAPELVDGKYDNGDKAGGILGYMAGKDKVTNCTVENVTIQGYRDLGGVVGIANGKSTVSGCTATGITIIQDNENGYKSYSEVKDLAQAIAGRVASGATVTDNNSSDITIKHINFGVAKIGETEYETLAEAVAAVKDGETILMLADVPNAGGMSVSSGKNFTVDFDGHTYTLNKPGAGSTGTETNGFQLLMNSTIVFKNGTINISEENLTKAVDPAKNIMRIIQNYANLTLENMTIDGTNQYGGKDYIMSFNNGTSVIKDTKVVGADKIAFDVCTWSGYKATSLDVTGNSEIKGDIEISSTNTPDALSLMLTSGTHDGAIIMAQGADKATVTKKNEFVQAAPADYKWKDNGDGTSTLVPCTYVAKIGDVKYESLAEAVAVVKDGETILMLADVPNAGGMSVSSGKNFTVDFDGHTYTLNKPGAGSTGTETNGFQLLMNSTIVFKNGTINISEENLTKAVDPAKNIMRIIQNYANLTLENMTIDGTNQYGGKDYIMSFNNGTSVIKDTKVVGADKIAFDVCTWSGYKATSLDVTGNSEIKGDIEISSTNTPDALSLMLTSGTHDGAIIMAQGADKATVTKKNDFVQAAPDGYKWVDNGNGTSTLKPCEYVAQYNNVKYETLQAALDAAEAENPQDIVIDLLGDATLDITAWSGTGNSLAIGTESTKSITINGHDNKLTFIYKNSDWNNVATMNDAVTKLILKDMAITHQLHPNSGGTWNGYDIGFNCAVELNNVTSDKALAFKNNATLNNVTITETHDYYAIWVSARGQSVSINGLNLTSSGRGIKIDDEYVDNPELTTLNIQNATFNTQKKAAILVKSDANTVITIGENVNIENVAADKTNVVWVDEDRAEEFYKVTVNNATIMPESKETDYVACLMKGEQRWGFYKGTSALSKAIGKVEDGYSIKLFQTTTEAVEVNKPLVITKNGFKADNVTAGEGFKKFETEAEIVIKSFNPVCAIDDEKYESLQEAVNAAGTNAATITLLADAATDGVITGNGVKVQAGQNITFDLKGLTYNVDKTVGSAGTETNGFQLLKGSTVKFTNGTLTSATAKILLQNYSDLTLDGVTVNAGSADYAVSNNFGSLTVTGETNINAKSGGCAFDLWYGMSAVYDDGISVVFDENFTGSVTGMVEYGHDSRVTDENWREKTKLEIKAGKFDIEFVNSSTDALNGANISISGGIFAKKPAEEYCADGYVVVDNEDEATNEQYPYTVKSKEDAGIFEFIDGIVNNTYLTYTTEKDATSITYTRTFKDSHVDKYQSWFIPFDYKITDDDAEKFQFFKVYMVSYSGSSEGGVITEKTKLYIFLEPVPAGTTLKANKPYVVKPSAAFTDYVFKSENVKLLPAPNDNVCLHTETSDTRYNFYGTYVAELHPSKRYEVLAVNGGQISWIAPKAYIPPYRWYIKPSVNNSSEQYGKITFEFIEEGDATSIEIPTETTDVIEGIYGVNGVKRDYLMPGLNIIKYANGKTKKIFK